MTIVTRAMCVTAIAACVGLMAAEARAQGCALADPAFCETFSSNAAGIVGRAGDLDPAKWGVGRIAPSDFVGTHNPVKAAAIQPCRSTFTQTANIFPPHDTLVCDNGQLMTAVRIQNYGSNSYMIRQPFDFAGRTGKIVFDVDAVSSLLGYFVAIEITDQPVPVPAFRVLENYEPGPTPRNALMLHLVNRCGGSVGFIDTMVYSNYVGAVVAPASDDCITVQHGSLNRFEVRLSETRVEVWASDHGASTLRLVHAANVNLNFSRGYVHLSARNHASDKYGYPNEGVYRWDNVGFDGPVLPTPRAYEIPDSTATGTFEGLPAMLLAYELAGTRQFSFSSVDLTAASSVQLTMTAGFWGAPTAAHGIRYRFNGGAWRDRPLSAGELQAVAIPGSVGTVSLVVDVPAGDVLPGANLLEVQALGPSLGLNTHLANIDLLINVDGVAPPPPPPTEVCGNGIDDDGDGQIDEDCAPPPPPPAGCSPWAPMPSIAVGASAVEMQVRVCTP
jgi:hypothetical protein